MSAPARKGSINRAVGVSRAAEMALMGDGWDRRVELVGGERLGFPVGERLGEEYGSLFDSRDGDDE